MSHLASSQYATAVSGGYATPSNAVGAPSGVGMTMYITSTPAVFTYAGTFTGGANIVITGEYFTTNTGGLTLQFSPDNVTYTATSPVIASFGAANATSFTNATYSVPNTLTGAYKYIKLNGVSTTYMYVDAIQTQTLTCNTCPSGATAPALSTVYVNVPCSSSTVNLSAITVSNKPANTVMTWHTGTPATMANKVADSTAVPKSGGVYYAAFYSAAGNCFSGINGDGTATTKVVIDAYTDCYTSQCANVNTGSGLWRKNTSVANNIIYNDGTETRLANSASSNARIADATAVNYSAAVDTIPVILPSASSYGAVTLPLGSVQTLSAIYATPNATPTGNTVQWVLGWGYNTAFAGAVYNGNANTSNTIATWVGTWAADIYVVYNGTSSSVNMYGSGGGLSIYSGTILAGDSIGITLIPQSDGSVVAQGYIYRPSIKAFLGQGSVTNALYANEAAYPIYPTLNIVYGAVNVGCIKQTTATNSAPNAGTCSTGFSSPWQLNNADPTYTIAFDGTETRQALKTNTATRGGDNNYVYDYALVRQDSARLSAGDTSIVTTSFLTPGTGMNYQRYYQGWAYSPNFNDINASTVGYTTGKTNWALLLYIQSNVLYYYDHTGTLNSVYAALAVGDQIIGTLIPNSSAGADLQITVYRPSIGAVIFSTYYINALTSTEASHPVYAAVLPITGAVNLSCIGSGLGSLPSVGGTAGSNQTICPGSTPSSNLTLSGNTGSVVKWQYSVDNFVSDVHDIASSASTTLTTAQMGALADTTYYRAVVQNAGSATAYSSIDTITVNVSVGGMASPNQAVCSGSSPSNLTLTGKGGSVIKWQYSSDNFASDVHDIASSASTTLTTGQMGALSATTYYRAVVQAGSCAVANSSIDTVIANVASVGGTTGSNQIVITGNAPLSNLTVTNYTGSVVKWQYSNNNFSSDVHDIPSSASPTLTTAQIGPVSTIQYYRASVKNGACPASNSSITVLDTLSLLPLHWLSLSATWAPPAVNVVWLSADEKQIDHYEVFRSGNGSSFELAGKMAVMKNSAATNKYSFADLNASSVSTDKLFYYVVAVNDDGGRDVSNIVTVKINNLPEKIMLYPNPTNGKIYFSSLKDVSTINIYSATGSLVRQIQNVSQGNLTYDLSMLASGFYIVHLIRNSGDPVSLNVSLIK